jgi:hypothetical protein
MIRQVPAAPLLSPVHRRLARLPLGGATGLACAAAGIACVVGLLLIGPSVGLSLPFRDEPVIGTKAPSHLEARAAAAKPSTTKTVQAAPGGGGTSSSGHVSGAGLGADQNEKPASTAEATDPPDASEPDTDEPPESTPVPARTPRPESTREESDRTDSEHESEWSDAERDDGREQAGEDPTP